MPRRRGHPGRPADYFDAFPDGVMSAAPVGVAEAAALARNLRARVEATDTTITGLAAASGVDRTTIYALLSGSVWVDTLTLARLEAVLGTLWNTAAD